MTTISPTRKLVTLINVFTVEPANQERLLDLLVRAQRNRKVLKRCVGRWSHQRLEDKQDSPPCEPQLFNLCHPRLHESAAMFRDASIVH
jgi:hypothetical protein